MQINRRISAWEKIIAFSLALLVIIGLLPTFSAVLKAEAAAPTYDREIQVTASAPAVIKSTDTMVRVYTAGAVTITGANKHGIFVENGFKGTIVLDNVDVITPDQAKGVRGGAAMFVDGSGFNDYNQITTEVLLLIKGTNSLYSAKDGTNGSAAGLEIWRGAKVIFDDYYAHTKDTDTTSEGSNLTVYAPQSPPNSFQNAGGAGIGAGNRPFSGGHMVMRGSTIVANASAHGAGVGDAWGESMRSANGVTAAPYATLAANTDYAGIPAPDNLTGRDDLWSGTLIVYGDANVTSNGGFHGAGIGGACYAASTSRGSLASIIAVPRGNTIQAKGGGVRPALGNVAEGKQIYLGDPLQAPIRIRTEDNRVNVPIYMNLEKVEYANTAILALADRIPGEYSRNLYPDMVYFENTGAKDGEGKAWAIKNGQFTAELEFYTTATTQGTNLNYDRETIANLAAGRDAILGYPSYSMTMESTVSTAGLSQGYSQALTDAVSSVVKVTNTGVSALKDVKLTVIDGGKNYFKIWNAATSTYVSTLTIAEIPAEVSGQTAHIVEIKVPLMPGQPAKGTPYEGFISATVESISTTETPDPVAISQQVGTRTLTTKIETIGIGNVVNANPFEVKVVFERGVDNFLESGIAIKNGTVSAGTLVATDTAVGGRNKEWKFTVVPATGLAEDTIIEIIVNEGAAKDDHSQNSGVSNELYLTYSESDPSLDFSFGDNEYFNKNKADVSFTIIANGSGTEYNDVLINGAAMSASNVGAGIEVYRNNVPVTGITYTVVGNKVTIAKAGGFGEGDYTVVAKDNYFGNNIGNKLEKNTRGFFVRIPVVEDKTEPVWPGGVNQAAKIHANPISVPYQGGETTITIYGKNFDYLDAEQLQILLPSGVDDASAGAKVEPTTIAPDGTWASYVVKLPRNDSSVNVVYTFEGFLNNTTIGDTKAAVLSADTNWTAADYGIKVSPSSTDYKAADIAISVKGENLHHYTNLNIRIYRAGVYTDTIPCVVTASGEVVIDKDYNIRMNDETVAVKWEFKLANGSTEADLIVAAGIGVVNQGAATPGIHEFTVSEDYDVKGSSSLVLESDGGTVFFRLDGVNLHNFRPIEIQNDGGLTPNPVDDTSWTYEGSDFALARLNKTMGYVIPPNRTQNDITYTFETYKNLAGVATGDKVSIKVKKPSTGVHTLDGTPVMHGENGGDSTFVLTGKHMQVSPLELRDQDRSGFNFTITDITNDGSDAKITIPMPAHTGGLRNDLYNMEAYFDGKATGLMVTIEVGPSNPSVTGGVANPNYYKDADATMDKPSEITVQGNYMYKYNRIHIYDSVYNKEYEVNVVDKDMTATVNVQVPSADGIYKYDIYADGVKTPHSVNINVGIALGQSDTSVSGDDETGNKGAGIKYEEFVGSGGGSKGGGYNGTSTEGFDLLKYQSERASKDNPQNPTVTLKDQPYISREQLDLAASGAKAGMLASDKSGVIYVERNKLGILTMLMDTTSDEEDNVLGGRIYLTLDKPLNGIYTGVYSKDDKVKDTVKMFKDKYANKDIWAVHLAQPSSYGTIVEIAVKLDIEEKTNDYELYFYRLDRKTGEFSQIEKPNHYFDTAGYLHFNTKNGGDIIVTTKPLTLDGKAVTEGTFPVKNTNKLAVDDKE